MYISKIKLVNFRSFASTELELGKLTVFVGRNNHGKSNVFSALEWFYTGKGDISAIRHIGANQGEEVIVEIEFSGVREGLAQISNADNRKKLENIVGDADTFRVRRTSGDAKNRFVFNPKEDSWQRQPVGADSAFNNCIPRFEFVLTQTNLREVSAYRSGSPIGQMLGNVLADALEQDPVYKDFVQKFGQLFQSESSSVSKLLKQTSERVRVHLEQQFPDCTSVNFNIDIPPIEEFLKNYTTTLDDGVVTAAEEKGDGMQRALMLAIIKAHADSRRAEVAGKSFVFLIDEAELHLHATAQRQLKSALATLTESVDQVLLTTHSSVFLAEEHSLQTTIVIEKDGGQSTGHKMTPARRARTVYDLLGGHPTDLLMPANFLIVEGPSEVEFLDAVCARHYSAAPRVQVVAADGDDERAANYLAKIMQVFNTLGDSPIYRDRVVILLDKPADALKARRLATFLQENPTITELKLLYDLPVDRLEDYYPETSRGPYGHLRNKMKLARAMGRNISKEDFETGMPVVLEALQKCWERAYTG